MSLLITSSLINDQRSPVLELRCQHKSNEKKKLIHYWALWCLVPLSILRAPGSLSATNDCLGTPANREGQITLEVHRSRSAKAEVFACFREVVKRIAYIKGGAEGSPADVQEIRCTGFVRPSANRQLSCHVTRHADSTERRGRGGTGRCGAAEVRDGIARVEAGELNERGKKGGER